MYAPCTELDELQLAWSCGGGGVAAGAPQAMGLIRRVSVAQVQCSLQLVFMQPSSPLLQQGAELFKRKTALFKITLARLWI